MVLRLGMSLLGSGEVSVLTGVITQLRWYKQQGYLTDANAALEELAVNLATTLDKGAGLAQAAVANQLRATLVEIGRSKSDDDDSDFGDWVSGLGAAGISALGNPKVT
jgi:hypothetical protein